MSKIAVLIPTYEPQGYIKRCLESLEKQTLSRSEFCVYVALNGPRKSYERFLEELLSQFSFQSRLVYLKPPGVSNARNYLIGVSEEEFITFVDDDDFVSENYLKSLLSVSDENYIGVSNVCNVSNTGEKVGENYIGRCFKRLKSAELSKFKTRKFYSSSPAKLIHRSMVENCCFDTKLDNGEDALFMAEISANVVGVRKAKDNACYYVYLRHGSASRKKVKKMLEVTRIFYLLRVYSWMFFQGGYSKLFILTRIAATLKHVSRLLR